jgi:hypothetical protein
MLRLKLIVAICLTFGLVACASTPTPAPTPTETPTPSVTVTPTESPKATVPDDLDELVAGFAIDNDFHATGEPGQYAGSVELEEIDPFFGTGAHLVADVVIAGLDRKYGIQLTTDDGWRGYVENEFIEFVADMVLYIDNDPILALELGNFYLSELEKAVKTPSAEDLVNSTINERPVLFYMDDTGDDFLVQLEVGY